LAGGAVLAGGVVWGVRHGGPFRVEVRGPSMVPSLVPGDKLLLAPLWRPLRAGEMVAFDDPDQPERLLVKRVGAVTADEVEVRGDNEGASRDSRTFGRVPLRTVRGRAVYRYAPAGRAGWL
jgi:nickel-type superoxide dismutase maturation protease